MSIYFYSIKTLHYKNVRVKVIQINFNKNYFEASSVVDPEGWNTLKASKALISFSMVAISCLFYITNTSYVIKKRLGNVMKSQISQLLISFIYGRKRSDNWFQKEYLSGFWLHLYQDGNFDRTHCWHHKSNFLSFSPDQYMYIKKKYVHSFDEISWINDIF